MKKNGAERKNLGGLSMFNSDKTLANVAKADVTGIEVELQEQLNGTGKSKTLNSCNNEELEEMLGALDGIKHSHVESYWYLDTMLRDKMLSLFERHIPEVMAYK